jgi:Spy/CpxP family protein refolding chaperone
MLRSLTRSIPRTIAHTITRGCPRQGVRRSVRWSVRATALLAALVALPAIAAPVAAQTAPTVPDPIARALFEPELIMKHRRAIALTDEQRDAISRLIKELQGEVVSLQWELQDQVEALAGEISRPRVDLDRAQDRMGRLLQTERRIKTAHLALLVRIKNVLTPQQQDALRKLRSEPAGSGGSPEQAPPG